MTPFFSTVEMWRHQTSAPRAAELTYVTLKAVELQVRFVFLNRKSRTLMITIMILKKVIMSVLMPTMMMMTTTLMLMKTIMILMNYIMIVLMPTMMMMTTMMMMLANNNNCKECFIFEDTEQMYSKHISV